MNYPKPIRRRFPWSIILVAAWLCLGFPLVSWADGMYVAPKSSFMYEPVQQAYIRYDAETATEQLSILPSFRGDASAFAWVVPVPSLPRVDPEEFDLFRDLDQATRIVYRSRDGDWGCSERNIAYDEATAPAGRVDILESALVGYYQTLVIAASDASALTDSLADWGFLHEDNLADVTAALATYVERSWYFVAMKVDSTALADLGLTYYGGYYGGGLEPIRLTFTSDEMIYPMRISAVSASEATRVHIYVNADHRMTFAGAETWYANRFTSREIDGLEYYPALAGRLQAGDFLTKLNRGYTPSEMDEDLILTRAADDVEFRIIRYSGLPWTMLVLVGPAGIWALYRRRKQHNNAA